MTTQPPPSEQTTPDDPGGQRHWSVPPVWVMVVVMLFVITGCLFFVWYEAQQRMRIVEYVHDRGGQISFEIDGRRVECSRRSGRLWWGGSSPPSSGWLFEFLGPTCFYPVTKVSVHFKDGESTEELLDLLNRCPQLQALSLHRLSASQHSMGPTELSIAGINNLNLIEIRLCGPWVDDATLRSLQSQTNLKELWLVRCQVGDDGLKHLHGIHTLGLLQLMETQVTREGLENLKKRLPACTIVCDGLPDQSYLVLP